MFTPRWLQRRVRSTLRLLRRRKTNLAIKFVSLSGVPMPLRRLVLTALATAVLGAWLTAAPDNGPAPNTLTDAEKKAGWILLFDGHSLDGWRGYKRPDAVESRWKAADGALTLPPDNGRDTHGQRDIISKDTFEQFELSIEWKISQGGNSGVKYFVMEDRDSAIGHEYQVIDDERHPDAKVGPHRQTGAFYDVLAATIPAKAKKPAGEWNVSKVRVEQSRSTGGHARVYHYLNEARILEYALDSPQLRAAIEKSKF